MAKSEDDYQHFVCIVAGDNPKNIIGQYDKNKMVLPYVIYKYKDAQILKNKYIETYEYVLKNNSHEGLKDTIEETIADLKEMTPHDFFMELTEEMEHDPVTGDAISTQNKDGKYSSCSIGKSFSMPFITLDGRETYQAKKNEINWDAIHLSGQDIYARAWEMVMEGSKPANDYEQQIFDNMQDKTTYFKKFETKENYIISNTAFWGYAFVSENTGWMDADEEDQFVWMKNFYNLFIKILPDDTLLTIYECKK